MKIIAKEKVNKNEFIDKKLVIKDDPDKILALRNSAEFKELQDSKLFTRIQCKTKSSDKEQQTYETYNSSFETLVMASVVSEEDPYLLSFARHIMYDQPEDYSKEAAIFFGSNEEEVLLQQS